MGGSDYGGSQSYSHGGSFELPARKRRFPDHDKPRGGGISKHYTKRGGRGNRGGGSNAGSAGSGAYVQGQDLSY